MRVEWRLPAILIEKGIPVNELYLRVREHGYVVNYSTVWRDVHQPPGLLQKLEHYCPVLGCTPGDLMIVRQDPPPSARGLSLPPPLLGPGP